MFPPIMLYTLSTCVHCKNTKQFLSEHSVPFECTDVDMLLGDERNTAIAQVKKWNPSVSFPTMVVNGGDVVIVGFNKDEISKAVGIQ